MHKDVDSIRQEFLNFFHKKNHQIISSSSLIPNNDQTLLFTNSGMNQFKDIFLGIDVPLYKRVVTAQRCMRAGGKHNDLDNVGYTERHLTFFEMLGNFSFGDYFKHDAIQFAVELLTDSNWFNLSIDRLWVTVHSADTESYDIWSNQIGISDKRIVRVGSNKDDLFCESDNFWKMGSIGPCGPCSEIFYDLGIQCCRDKKSEDFGKFKGGDRYIEIWNLVFMQFVLQVNGNLSSLPMLSVDTGMGLERIAAVLQGKNSNYSIDLFRNLIFAISQIVKIDCTTGNRSLYVIADHIRSCSFLIRDGVIPNNEGRGYVLRRIIRRAILHGKKLGITGFFLYKLVAPLISCMHYFSAMLHEKQDFIEKILLYEEQLFEGTLQRGLELLEKKLMQLQGNVLHGEIAFYLYSTYGFPLELIRDICFDRNIIVDQDGFEQAMSIQKRDTKKLNRFHNIDYSVIHCNQISSVFVGYNNIIYPARIVALFQKNKSVQSIAFPDDGIIILDNTPFYGESGGQIGDSGKLKTVSGSSLFQVVNTKKYGTIITHLGKMIFGNIKVGDEIIAEVDSEKRRRICLNHSATHLLRAALYQILGSHIAQKGSLVHDQYLRFDFTHQAIITCKEIDIIENLVNQKIWNNLPVMTHLMSIESAKNIGAVMLFDKQYSKKVRVLKIGDFSVELCGGTHVNSTKEIGIFIINKEFGISTGVRRIEARTEHIALSIVQHQKRLLRKVEQVMHVNNNNNLLDKVNMLNEHAQQLKKEVRNLKDKEIIQQSLSLVKKVRFIKDVRVLIEQIKNIESKLLFVIIDHLKFRLKSGIIIFINIKSNTKIHLVISITDDLVESKCINALDLLNSVINAFGKGKGGGQPNFAQAGIDHVTASEVIIKINSFLCNKI